MIFRRTRSYFAAALFALVFLTLPQPASASEDAAQVYFEAGAALYFEGRYADALVQFKKAHAESPNATFQYNIAVCNLRLERYDDALSAARNARELGGLNDTEIVQNEARIAAIPRIQRAIRAATTIGESRPPDPEPEVVAVQPAPTPATQSKRRFGPLGWVGVGSTAIGSGMLVAALVTELTLQAKWDDYRAAADVGDAARYTELQSEIVRGQLVGKVLLIGGAGLAATGATLIVVELLTGERDSAATAMIVPLPDGGVATSFSLRF